MSQAELKGIIEDISKGVANIFNLSSFSVKINSFVNKFYNKGLEQAEVQFNMNFFSNQVEVEALKNYTFDLVKGMTDEMVSDLRQEIQRGVLNNESVDQIKKRVNGVFKGDNPTRFRYEDRLKSIARTESNRAENMGHLEGAQQSGVNLVKYLDVTEDERTSGICSEMHKKYGTPEQGIPLDKEFSVTFKGKRYHGQAPPFHPNERTRVLFIDKASLKK